jgi:hypothetical protein
MLMLLAATSQATPIGNPSASNGWSTTGAVSIAGHSGERTTGNRYVANLINGSGVSGTYGQYHSNASTQAAMFATPPTGSNASSPNPGTLQGTGSHWVEFEFDQTYPLKNVAIWNYNEKAWSTQGWKNLVVQVSETGTNDPRVWTTVYDARLPATSGGATATASLVIGLGGIEARHVTLINSGIGTEATWLTGDDGIHAGLSEVRFNSRPPLPGTFEPTASFGGGFVSWGDYNKDGWVDLNVDGQLYRNDQGKFLHDGEVSKAGPFGDYDNDGDLDIYDPLFNKLHQNQGDGTFQQVAFPDLGTQQSRAATWGDFNGDHYLDLYVSDWESAGYLPDKIATNNGDGTFSVTWTQGIDSVYTAGWPRPARGVTSADFDRDGDMDVYVSNYRLEPNGLYVNDGTGRFTDLASERGATGGTGHTIGSAWGDLDNDGNLDLLVGNFSHNWFPQPGIQFLRNTGPDGGYNFQSMVEWNYGSSGQWQESYTSPALGDYDNDGDLDLFIPTLYDGDSARLYRNDGNWNFTNVTSSVGLAGLKGTYQAAFADYDHDGFLDLFTNGTVYRNVGGRAHWLKVRLDGGGLYNATAIGAQAFIQLGDQTLVRQVESSVGEGNQNDMTLHFGLGGHTGPLELDIVWPDGLTQTVEVLNIDQTITVSPQIPTLTLNVDRNSGMVSIASEDGASLLSGYTITSASGSLDPDRWSPLLRNSAFGGWQIADPRTSGHLAEINPGGASSLGEESVNLGPIFAPVGQTDDLVFEYLLSPGGAPIAGLVVYEPAVGGLPGDFNLDGVVDARDYTLWRDHLGQEASTLNGNGSGGSTVGQADYLLWRDNFGTTTTGENTATHAPEPTSCGLAAWMAGILLAFRYRSTDPTLSDSQV